MKINKAFCLSGFVSLLMLLSVSPIFAHHSSAIYDRNREILFEGIVTRFEWSNPHIFIHVEGEADDRPMSVWQFETSNPSMMRSRGWDKKLLKRGDRVTIGGNPSNNKRKNIALLTHLEKGTVDLLNQDNFFGSRLISKADAEQTTDSLNGQWVIVPDADLYQLLKPWNLELTDKGRRAIDEYDERTMLPQLKCIASVAPTYMVVPDLKVIELGDEAVIFRSEYQSVERLFHLNADNHDGYPLSLHGHAIAHWENDVLIVDTANFAENRTGHMNGLTSGIQKQLREEFQLNQDGKSLTYRFSLKDPEYFSNVVTGEAQYLYSPQRNYSPDACSLENAQRLLEFIE